MRTQIRTSFLFYTFTLFLCFNSFSLTNPPAQVGESALTRRCGFRTNSPKTVRYWSPFMIQPAG